MLNIAIIGGGVQGICLLDELVRNVKDCKVSVFEKSNCVGGVWANHGRVPHMGLQISSMHYRFPTFPHDKSVDLAKAEYVNKYINDYVDAMNLRSYITFNTTVTRVSENTDKTYDLYTENTKLG